MLVVTSNRYAVHTSKSIIENVVKVKLTLNRHAVKVISSYRDNYRHAI